MYYKSRLVGAEGGARWNELGVTATNCFDVFNVCPGSRYYFRVTPKNRYGWGHSVQTSNAIKAGGPSFLPQFTEILPDRCEAMIGERFVFECAVTGIPSPRIIWFKDGIPIDGTDADRVKLKLIDSATCRLEISEVRSSDAGRYVCEATNTRGRTSTSTPLKTIADYRIFEARRRLSKWKSNIDLVISSKKHNNILGRLD